MQDPPSITAHEGNDDHGVGDPSELMLDRSNTITTSDRAHREQINIAMAQLTALRHTAPFSLIVPE